MPSALRAWAVYRQKPERALLIAMPVILLGLVLALDVVRRRFRSGRAGPVGAHRRRSAL